MPTTSRHAHRLADDGEGLGADLVVRRDVVAIVEIDRIDLGSRRETLDVDRVAALDFDLVQLFVGDGDVIALGDLIALDALVALDDVAGFGVDILLLEAIAGLGVQHVEGNLLGRARGGEKRDGTGDERELQIALPVRPRRHDKLQTQRDATLGVKRGPGFSGSAKARRRNLFPGTAFAHADLPPV